MIFRDATPDDAPALKALHMESWRTAYAAFAPAEVFAAPLEADMSQRWDTWPKDRLIRVADDGGIIGFAAVDFRPHPYLDNLHVAPNLKRRGIGQRLMTDLASVLLEHGHQNLALTVIEGNSRARAFYKRCGGTEGPARPDLLLGHPISVIPVNWDETALKKCA